EIEVYASDKRSAISRRRWLQPVFFELAHDECIDRVAHPSGIVNSRHRRTSGLAARPPRRLDRRTVTCIPGSASLHAGTDGLVFAPDRSRTCRYTRGCRSERSKPGSVQAGVLRAVGEPLSIEDVPAPEIGPSEVLIESHTSGISGRRVHILAGHGYVHPLSH